MDQHSCPACGARERLHLVDISRIPVHVGVLWGSAEAARSCAVGDISLVLCEDCGLVSNERFDASLLDYTLDYDNSLHASAVFREFESALVADLVERHDLHHRNIVEIGGGSGHFIELLCEAGDNTGVCFDPSIGESRTVLDGRIELRAEYVDACTDLGEFDLLCCRQVLEHVPDLHGFLTPIVTAMSERPGATAYLDVPNSEMLFRDLSIWDLVYEHCHYFVPSTLLRLFDATRLDVGRSWTTFENQFASIELSGATTATPTPVPMALDEVYRDQVLSFAGEFDRRRSEWRSRLDEFRSSGRRVAVWGAGARAVSFFSMLEIGDEVAYLVDSNPRKQGTFIAGSGHAIHPPDHLGTEVVDVVVLLNGIYEREIGQQLLEMGLQPVVIVA